MDLLFQSKLSTVLESVDKIEDDDIEKPAGHFFVWTPPEKTRVSYFIGGEKVTNRQTDFISYFINIDVSM